MKTKTYFAFRIDIWDDGGDSIGSVNVRFAPTTTEVLRCREASLM
jgi:hypothetical protein